MVPHGDEHEMGNGVGGPLYHSEQGMEALLSGGLLCSRIGGGGEETRLVCGYLACDAGLIRPVLAGLPHVVRVHLRNDRAGEWLQQSILHGVERAQAAAPGSDVILAKLAEVLFTEALQRYVMQLPVGRTGWLAGASDATVGRSLAALHHRPAHPWTLDELAEEAGVSRSALTERFARYLGREPDRLSHRLASRARGRGAAHVEPQRAAGRLRGRLRIGGRVQPGLQAEVRQPAGAVSARVAREAERRSGAAGLSGLTPAASAAA